MKKMARIIWFTGLSGSGKTTLAQQLLIIAERSGLRVRVVDGDDIRSTEHRHLGFTREDIIENNRRIINFCRQQQHLYNLLLVPVIAPFQETRNLARKTFGDAYIEVYVQSSLETCMKRDVKGLYEKVKRGEIQNFIGVDKYTPYETPTNSAIQINTEQYNQEESVKMLVQELVKRRILA